MELDPKFMDGCPDRNRDPKLYTFLVGGDGRVYEGRGYTNTPSKVGDKWAKYEGKSFDVAYIGRFSEDRPAYPDMAEAGLNLIQHAVLDQHVDLFFDFVEDKKRSQCIDDCPYPAPDPEPGDPIVDFEGLGI
ncbi:peptidoglycan-recognition protein SB2-like isoform X1 [Macrosteles quadrilineatus]|uniref:peptidoglycan-recognition protein SB2-like isoform X1 n=1 Tax=Macrosteles quadrilineatus TaxID=74068 RepID=UPI0023E09BA8|nr:peptidoglycan-recognition protein SB2-like isoform X1 [Macrosteles quadrilineatus]